MIFQDGAFTNAVEECKLYLEESDGELLSSWLLSEWVHVCYQRVTILIPYNVRTPSMAIFIIL